MSRDSSKASLNKQSVSGFSDPFDNRSGRHDPYGQACMYILTYFSSREEHLLYGIIVASSCLDRATIDHDREMINYEP